MGFQLSDELCYLGDAVKEPNRPFAAIVLDFDTKVLSGNLNLGIRHPGVT